jgi:uncharacterized DUF497 family protein
MRIFFDPTKRDYALSECGLDFDDAALNFAGVTLEVEDTLLDLRGNLLLFAIAWHLLFTSLQALDFR